MAQPRGEARDLQDPAGEGLHHGLTIGVPLSLSGRFARFGRQSLEGLRLWAEHASVLGQDVRLVVRDDRGVRDGVARAVRDLLDDECADVLFGPYGSHLTLAALEAAGGRLLWNHGGASDEVAGRVVSVLSPASDYFRDLPRVVEGDFVVLHAPRGTFGRQVASGVAQPSRPLGREAPPRVVLAAGFDEEIAWIRARPKGVRVLAAVSAGVAEFGAALGRDADGIVGPSQWEGADGAVDLGPSEWPGDSRPDYPAVAAFATGLIFAECARRAGALEDEALLRAARGLRVRTLFGRFALDASGRQIGHGVRLVRWRDGVRSCVR